MKGSGAFDSWQYYDGMHHDIIIDIDKKAIPIEKKTSPKTNSLVFLVTLSCRKTATWAPMITPVQIRQRYCAPLVTTIVRQTWHSEYCDIPRNT